MKDQTKVAYKPLGTVAPPSNQDDDGEDGEEEDFGAESHDNKVIFDYYKYDDDSDHQERGSLIRNLKQLRSILYLLATLLFLIFIVRLTSRQDPEPGHPPAPSALPVASAIRQAEHQLMKGHAIRETIPETSSKLSITHNTPTTTTTTNESHKLADTRPQYDTYLSSILREKDTGRRSGDDLAQQEQTTSGSWWTVGQRGANYTTITNYIRAMKSFKYNSSITLTTQGTTEFLYNTLELCKRWDGPISLSVFTPGPELQVAMTLIKYMRQCLPAPLSACIRDKVTWHLVYNTNLGPAPADIGLPFSRLDSHNFPLFVRAEQCPKLPGPETNDLIKQFELLLRKKNVGSISFREKSNLTYPINVLRNVARLAAQTHYLLASDIELYPSINLVPQFMEFIRQHHDFTTTTTTSQHPGVRKYIFTLPIFEIKSSVTSIPKTKRQLVSLINTGDAIFFHRYVCDICQKFPNRSEWLRTDILGQDFQSDNELSIFVTTQRDRSKDSWEPIFIGTNADPLYDDRLTWDGRRDKMGQMYEMCLEDYHLLVLGNAFLVHAPGIKHIDNNDVRARYHFMRSNNLIYSGTIARLRAKYANSANINKC